MTLKPLHGLFVALALAAAAPSATAAEWGAAMRRGDLGTASQATVAERTVKITASTQYVSVEHFGTVKIENDKGQSFTWKFDTLGEVGFPLSVIAPKGFAAGETSLRPHPTAPGQLIAIRTRLSASDGLDSRGRFFAEITSGKTCWQKSCTAARTPDRHKCRRGMSRPDRAGSWAR